MNARADFTMSAPASAPVAPAGPLPPFRWAGGDLGLGNEGEPWLYIVDSTGKRWLTHSVQYILANIDHFPDERDRKRLLAGAALHYGLDVWTLIDGREAAEPLWDMLDDAGRLLLVGVTHHAAWLASAQLRQLPGWTSGFRYVLQRDGQARAGLLWDWRHEGPLVLMHHSLGVDDLTHVAVRSHAGGCCVTLEEALRRLDQFSADDQAELLAGLARHFGLSMARLDGAPN